MQVIELDPTVVRKSKSNPRKTFTGIEDLARSFGEVGQIDPAIVRELPKGEQNGVTHELVTGERRWRAAGVAKLPLRAIVRELTDEQVLEMQIVENDQRVDVSPIEQAESYVRLQKLGYSIEQIATKLTRSVSFVAKRLKLTTLIKDVREALAEGKIVAGVAELIARIPDPVAQKKALEMVLPDDPKHGGYGEGTRLCTVEEAREILRDEFMIKLERAQFDRADAKLVEKAGACATCPKRTGAQAELFGDVEAKDLCTDPTCYRSKCDAHWKLVQLQAKTAKQPTLTAEQAKKIFYDDGRVVYGSGYVRADDTWYLGNTSKRVDLIVGKDVVPTLGQAPNGTIVKLYPKDLVDRKEKSVTRSSSSGPSTADKAQKLKKELDTAAKRAVMAAIVAKAEKTELGDTHLRLIVAGFAAQEWRLEEVTRRRKLDVPTGAKKQPSKSKTLGAIPTAAASLKAGELAGLLVEVALANANQQALLDRACELYRVDASAIGEKARSELKAARAEKAKKPATPKAIAKAKSSLVKKGVAKPSKLQGKALKAAAGKAKPAKKKAGAK